MKRNWPWVLLLLSLVLNGFFLGGYFYADLQLDRLREPPSDNRQALMRRLHLGPEQRALLRTLRGELQAAARQYRASDREVLDRYWRQMADGPPPVQRRHALLAPLSQHQQVFLRKVDEALTEFLRVLGPKQRQRFIRLARRHHLFRALAVGRP